MNENALIQYISYNLRTCVQRFDSGHNLTDTFSCRRDLKDVLGEQRYIHAQIFARFPEDEQSLPHVFLINGFAVYSLVRITDGYVLVGPVCLDFSDFLVQRISSSDFPNAIHPILAVHEYADYIRNILLIHNLYSDEIATEEMLPGTSFPTMQDSIQKFFNQDVFKRMETGDYHNPYEQEVREQTSIEQGDIEGLKKSVAESYDGSLGILADSPLRSAKNIGIVVITLASRSAIRGGVLPEVAFSLSDSYIQQLEHVTDITSVQYLIRKAELQYAEMVREQMQKEKGPSVQKSPYISQCQNYIYSHLHDKITVQELAKELGIHANYLSGLFKEQMGISLSRYILEEKVSRAKNLLVYSQYSFIEIAAYLGFSSQSYFSLQFKKVTGYTPKAYRDTFAVQDF